MMLRKLANAILLGCALTASQWVSALGLGEIKLDSALNQPLKAEIELLNVRSLETWEIKPQLADAGDFDRAGIERFYFLTSVKFNVVYRPSGEAVIELSTSQPVKEPFLNFLVEVNWPDGRLLREFTLLLDPPAFSEQPADDVSVAQPEPQQDSQSDYNEQDEEQPYQPDTQRPAPPVSQPEEPASSSRVDQTDYSQTTTDAYRVKNNDTLWEIAQQVRPDRRLSPQQTMLAIQDLNPDAFIGGNINRLKRNQVLRVPSYDQIVSRSFRQAVREVAIQNRAFDASRQQLDATGRGSGSAPSADGDDAELKLLAPESNRSAAGTASGDVSDSEGAAGRTAELDAELGLALENLDKFRRENAEMREQLESMQKQIDTLQKLIALKDDQLAALQTIEGEQQVGEGDLAVPVEGEVAANDEMADEAAVTVGGDEAGVQDAVDGEVDYNYGGEEGQTEESTTEGQDTTETVASQEPAAVTEEKVEEPAPREERRRRRNQSFLDQLMDDPLMLVQVLLGLILLVAGAFYVKKRLDEKKAAENEDFELDKDLDGEIEGGDFPDLDGDDDLSAEISDLDTDIEEMPEGEFSLDDDFSADEAGEAGEIDTSTDDVLELADSYTAYDRHQQAANILEEKLETEPEFSAARLKLLSVYADMENSEKFAEHEKILRDLNDDEFDTEISVLRGKLAGASDDIDADDFNLDDNDLSDSVNLGDESSIEAPSDDVDFGELDFDLDEDSPAEDGIPSVTEEASDDDEFSLDFDSDLSGEGEEISSESIADDVDDVELELPTLETESEDENSLDFDVPSLDEEVEPETLEADDAPELEVPELEVDESDDFSLDFDLDSGDDSADEVPASLEEKVEAAAEDADDDLGLDFELDGDSSESIDVSDSAEDEALSVDFDLEDDDNAIDAVDSVELDAGDEVELDIGSSELEEIESDLPELSLDEEESSLDDSGLDEIADIDLDDSNLDGDDLAAVDDIDLDAGDLDSADLDTGDLDSGDLDIDLEEPADDAELDLSDLESDDDLDLGELDAGDSTEESAEAEIPDLGDLEESDDLGVDLDLGDGEDFDLGDDDLEVPDLADQDDSDEVDLNIDEDEALNFDLADTETEIKSEDGVDFEEAMDAGDSIEESDVVVDSSLSSTADVEDTDIEVNEESVDFDAAMGDDLDVDLDLGDDDLDEVPTLDSGDLEVEVEGDTDSELDVDTELDLGDDTSDIPELSAAMDAEEPELAELELEDEDLDVIAGTDEVETKLDLARAYIDMEDVDGAKELLEEVMSEGSDEQKKQAQELVSKL